MAHEECRFDQALSRIPAGMFIMTSAHEDARSGVLVRWVQQCSSAPPMVLVAVHKGQPIEPLIRDSRTFALCQVDSSDLFLRRKFQTPPDNGEDPFIALDMTVSTCGAPIIERAAAFLDCELTRHIDIDSDFEIYIGIVRDARVLQNGH